MRKYEGKVACPGCGAEVNYFLIPPEPIIKAMTLRLKGMHRRGQMLWERPKDLGVALIFFLDTGDGKLLEYGHAVRLSREKLEEILATGDVFIWEKDKNEGSINETYRLPCDTIQPGGPDDDKTPRISVRPAL